ncbi:MAG: hypothetical protein ACFFBD_08765 [Candidatus Hodarchaeota archaeon]
MQAKEKEKEPQQYSQFIQQLELRTGKGIPISQIPCTYAIAYQNRCLIFGFVTLCPLKCPKFRLGEPIDEENELINTWCKFLEKMEEDYYCSIKGQLSEQNNCQNCPSCLEGNIHPEKLPKTPNRKNKSWKNIFMKIKRRKC